MTVCDVTEPVHEAATDDTTSDNHEPHESSGVPPATDPSAPNYADAAYDQPVVPAYVSPPIYYPSGESGAILGPPFGQTALSQQHGPFLG